MAKPTTWENRIVGEGLEDPEQLLANPKNYRIHPRGQQQQMEAIFDKVGIVQRVIVNRRTGHLVDGHMRVQLAMGRVSEIPVVYVDLTQEEEDLVLATLIPLVTWPQPTANSSLPYSPMSARSTVWTNCSPDWPRTLFLPTPPTSSTSLPSRPATESSTSSSS